jgi:multidrug resistance efflux pump
VSHRWRIGDRVQLGQLLVQLDDREAKEELTIKQARLDGRKATLRAAQAAKEAADLNYAVHEKLVAQGAISREELAGSRLARVKCNEEIQSEVAAVEAATGELRLAKLRVESHQIRSPARGVIAAVLRQPGEAVRKYEPIVELKVADEAD